MPRVLIHVILYLTVAQHY